MVDNFKEKINGIYGWYVKDCRAVPPKHTFPKAVKERADYFAEMMEDGLTFLGCLDFIFSDEKPEHYDFGATKPWIDKSPEFKEWECGLGTESTFSHQEMAIYLLFPFWEEVADEVE